MLKIKDHLIKTIKSQRANEEKEKAIEKKKVAVEAYGSGTTGYRCPVRPSHPVRAVTNILKPPIGIQSD